MSMALLAGTMLGSLPVAWANRVQVAPTMVEMTANRPAEAMWLSNTAAHPMPVQVRVYRWTQDHRGEQLTPTTDIVVSPAQATIPPGRRQLIRVLRRAAVPDRETAFRLIVDELPTEQPARARVGLESGAPASAPASGLQFRLRYSIPVFQAGRNVGEPVLSAAIHRSAATDTDPMLLVTNSGAGRAQLADVALLTGDGPDGDADAEAIVVAGGLLGYVLHGRTMRWSLRRSPPGGSVQALRFRLNGETGHRTIPIRFVDQPAPRP